MTRLDDQAFAKALSEAERKFLYAPRGLRIARLAALRTLRFQDLKRELLQPNKTRKRVA